MHESGPDPDREAEARRRAQLEQLHLEAYRNIHRLRDALCRRYAALLKDKVQSQRSLLQQRDQRDHHKDHKDQTDHRDQRDQRVTAKSQTETRQRQKTSVSSKLQHDDSFLKSLHKTSYYLIFDLQQQLAERGHLKTHHDLEDFYRSIMYNRHPSQLQRSLEDVRKNKLEDRPEAELRTRNETSEKHPSTAQDGGHQDRSRLSEETSGSGESSTKDETEQMFPKMKAPTFATLQSNFMKSFQSQMPGLVTSEIPEQSRKAEIYLSRLRRMHSLCLTNMAATQRLLDRDGDSLCWQEERSNRDLLLPGVDTKQRNMNQTNQPPLCSLKQPRNVQDDRPSSPQQPSRATSASRPVWDAAVCCSKTPDPLSIEDVCQQKHVEIIDCGPKVWRNYTENTDH